MLIRDLAKLPKAQKEKAIAEIVAKANGPEGRQRILAELRALEDRHGMTTAEMCEGFRKGTVPDEYEFVRWLMLARSVSE